MIGDLWEEDELDGADADELLEEDLEDELEDEDLEEDELDAIERQHRDSRGTLY
jgi:hypothetical protein